jgi:hypothetical protein
MTQACWPGGMALVPSLVSSVPRDRARKGRGGEGRGGEGRGWEGRGWKGKNTLIRSHNLSLILIRLQHLDPPVKSPVTGTGAAL